MTQERQADAVWRRRSAIRDTEQASRPVEPSAWALVFVLSVLAVLVTAYFLRGVT